MEPAEMLGRGIAIIGPSHIDLGDSGIPTYLVRSLLSNRALRKAGANRCRLSLIHVCCLSFCANAQP
jgi:hypothetical protein